MFRSAAVLSETCLHLTENLLNSRCDSSLDYFQQYLRRVIYQAYCSEVPAFFAVCFLRYRDEDGFGPL